jgi:glycosyltransferase involved in cell wall biosynthesis
MLTQWFDPEPTFKGLAFANALRDAGHEVEVLTGFPNYPGGKIYPGYRQRWLSREDINGIRVNRVPLYPSHDSSALGRVVNYITFAISACLLGIFGVRRADVIYCYHPPLTVGLSGVVISFLKRTPLVYDIQDLWPDTLKATGMVDSPRMLKVVEHVCHFVYRRAASLVVLSPGFKSKLVARGVPAEKIDVIYNWCHEDALSNDGIAEPVPEVMVDRFNIVFAGTMGKAQALDSILAAAALAACENKNVQFVLVGGGIDVERLKGLVVHRGLDNVQFLPRLPMHEIGKVMRAADALIVHLRDDPLFSITVPSKTQAYMAVGKPIIMAVRGDAADLVVISAGGVLAEPEQPESIAAAVLKLVSMPNDELVEMGRRARRYYFGNLSLQIGVEKFSAVFLKACAR